MIAQTTTTQGLEIDERETEIMLELMRDIMTPDAVAEIQLAVSQRATLMEADLGDTDIIAQLSWYAAKLEEIL